MATVLTIAGQVVDLDATRTVFNRLALSVDEPDSLEWGQLGVSLPLEWHAGQDVQLAVDGTLVFSGELVSTHLSPIGEGPIDAGYRALGLRWVATYVPVTNPLDGTGTIVFNLPSTDPNFIAQLSGMSVGAILSYLFTGHAEALAAVGIVGFEASDLTNLTIVPPTWAGVLIQGSSVIDQAEILLQNWYAQYVLYIPANGIIRVVDSTAFTPTTLTLDSDPVTLDEISRDCSQCYTRVVIRGYAEVEPAYLSLSMGTLKEGFTAAEKLAWNWYAFVQPGGAIESGTITALTSTGATLQPSVNVTHVANFWSGIEAQIQLINPAASDISFTENRQITANSVETAGGTYTVTFDQPLVNSGYSTYYIWGQPPTVSDTWRLYDIVPTYVAQHLVKTFPHSVPWSASSSEVVQVNSPVANVCWSPNGQQPFIEFPAQFEILPASGQIRFSEPVVRIFGTLTNLEAGGNKTDGIPDDIKVLVAYSRGTLTAVCPADYNGVPQYQGTAFTADGIQETLYRDFPQWMWSADLSNYQQLACQILATVNTTLVAGSLTYWGKLSSALTLGQALNVARAGGTTGFEGINAAIRTVVLEYPQTGPTPWVTHLHFSTVRRPFSGELLYAHPMFAGGQAFGAAGFSGIDMSSGGMAAALAGGLSYMGEDVGKEIAAQKFGNSNELRKSLGLAENKEPAEERGGETSEAPETGDEFGGEGGEDEPRYKKKKKRATLKPRAKPAAAPNDPFRYGPTLEATDAATAETGRRQRAQNRRGSLAARRGDDEPEQQKPAPYVPPQTHGGTTGTPGLAQERSLADPERKREEKAQTRRKRGKLSERRDDDE